jgi:hypothetical protein
MDPIVAPDPRTPGDHYVRADPGARADFDVFADHRIGSDFNARCKQRTRMDGC